jgi:hypothetical protein
LQSVLGGLGSGLGRSNPGVVHGQGGDPLGFGLLNPDPADHCLPQLRHLEVPTDQLHARTGQLGGEGGERAERH